MALPQVREPIQLCNAYAQPIRERADGGEGRQCNIGKWRHRRETRRGQDSRDSSVPRGSEGRQADQESCKGARRWRIGVLSQSQDGDRELCPCPLSRRADDRIDRRRDPVQRPRPREQSCRQVVRCPGSGIHRWLHALEPGVAIPPTQPVPHGQPQVPACLRPCNDLPWKHTTPRGSPEAPWQDARERLEELPARADRTQPWRSCKSAGHEPRAGTWQWRGGNLAVCGRRYALHQRREFAGVARRAMHWTQTAEGPSFCGPAPLG